MKYRIQLHEGLTYTYEIDANSEDEAIDVAFDLHDNDDTRDQGSFYEEPEIVSVVTIPQKK